MVGRLARRLERQPDDLQGWLMLGRSYFVIGQFDLSVRAYQRADALAKGQNADALMGQGEALLEGELSDLAGRAGDLFEAALKLDATSTKAWFYGAFAARERNELPLARERFERLLRGNPPAQLVQLIEQQISEIDALLAMTGNAPAGRTVAAAAAKEAAPQAVVIPLRITLAQGVADKTATGARLFVLARIPGQGGPPLAAKLLDVQFPQDVDLLSTDAMMGGSGFVAGQELEIEARIANSGGAISRSGDPFGTVRLKAGGKPRTTVEINRLKP
jgi:cytochrome c-type biogenesis protein CcmH